MIKLSPTAAQMIARAYGRKVEPTSGGIWLINAKGDDYSAMIHDEGSITPWGGTDSAYTRADHEVAMAIRASLELRHRN